MGKHEIKLRRKAMTSRRIERHKNYALLMSKHQKSQRLRKLVQWLIYVVVFLLGVFAIYYSLDRKEEKRAGQAQIKACYERPLPGT